jgi:hypothetical protein
LARRSTSAPENQKAKIKRQKYIQLLFGIPAAKRFTAGLILILTIALSTCGKKKTISTLYNECKSTTAVKFLGMDSVMKPAGGSPHGEFKLRFNSLAASALDHTGRLAAGASFPNGSVIVKEVIENGNTSLYAVMKKDPKSRFASHKWIWAELGPEGSEIYSVSKRGEACIDCHSQKPNRDLTRTFDYH